MSRDEGPRTRSEARVVRLVPSWEAGHAATIGAIRFAGGGFSLGVGLVLVSLGRKADNEPERRKCYRFATWFLVSAALQFLGGSLDLAVARSRLAGSAAG